MEAISFDQMYVIEFTRCKTTPERGVEYSINLLSNKDKTPIFIFERFTNIIVDTSHVKTGTSIRRKVLR